MLQRIDAYASVGLIVVGAVHTISRLAVSMEDLGDLWFMGTGLALSLLGLLNVIRLSAKLPVVSMVCAIANVIGSLFLLLVTRMFPAPQVLLVLVIALTATLCSVVAPVRANLRA